MVRSGSSYCSQSDLAPTFGLGQDTVVQALDVEWPSGAKQRFANVPTNQVVTIDEAQGIVPAKPADKGRPPDVPGLRSVSSTGWDVSTEIPRSAT